MERRISSPPYPRVQPRDILIQGATGSQEHVTNRDSQQAGRPIGGRRMRRYSGWCI
jgi:hypothetical protein